MFKKAIQKFAALPEIEAIALGGSRAGDCYDNTSDYDIYLYCREAVSEETRRQILEPISVRLEIGNCFWELEDNGTFRDGVDFDILYRNLDEFVSGVSDVVEKYQTGNAYTTCMWHNLMHCKILYDKNGRLAAAKNRFAIPYPEPLREKILNSGWRLLSSSMPAYQAQILKASRRADYVSINHRTTAFLETYFDMLFALNRVTHPGEKRLMALCRQNCPLLPADFEENLNSLFSHMFVDTELLSSDLSRILGELSKIL